MKSNNSLSFEEFIDDQEVSIVLFKSKSCESCKSALSAIEEIGHTGIPFYFVDVHEDKKMALKYSVEKVPTVILFKYGRIERVLVGAMSKFSYLSEIKKALVI